MIVVYLVWTRVTFFTLLTWSSNVFTWYIKKLFNVLTGIHVSLFCTNIYPLFSFFLQNNKWLQTKMIFYCNIFFKKRYCRYPRNCNVSFNGRCFYLFVWKLSKLLQISYNSSNKKEPNKVITFITHQPFDFSVHKYSMFSKAIKWSTNILMSVVEL